MIFVKSGVRAPVFASGDRGHFDAATLDRAPKVCSRHALQALAGRP